MNAPLRRQHPALQNARGEQAHNLKLTRLAVITRQREAVAHAAEFEGPHRRRLIEHCGNRGSLAAVLKKRPGIGLAIGQRSMGGEAEAAALEPGWRQAEHRGPQGRIEIGAVGSITTAGPNPGDLTAAEQGGLVIQKAEGFLSLRIERINTGGATEGDEHLPATGW